MNKQVNKQERKDRLKSIDQGINDFLDDNGIDLTKQNFKRVKTHLFKHYEDERSISATVINNYLSRIFEHNEINREYLDSDDGGSNTEDLLVSVVLTADNKRTKYFKRMLLSVLVVGVMTCAGVYAQNYFYAQPITIVQSNELKDLVSEVVQIEADKNEKPISPNTVWKILKDLESVQRYGSKGSYKDFTQGQHKHAKQYLEQRIEQSRETNVLSAVQSLEK